MINPRQASILAHTSSNGRYVSDLDEDLSALIAAGFLRDHGAQRLAGGMHYMCVTPAGRAALSECKAAERAALPQPAPPPQKKRRRSAVFDAWMSFRDVYDRIPFAEFRREVWPLRRSF